ncbi:MAG: lysylphosphatidylglycerol synthase transmembrane domain-containing protein [Bacteroidales bacterium]
MKEKLNSILRVLIFLCLSGLLLFLAFRKVEFQKIAQALVSAKYGWLVLSFTFSMFAFFSRARRWILMIRPLGHNPSFRNTYHAMMTGYLVNFALPRMGEVSKCVALGKKEKIPVDSLIGTVIVERTFDVISMLAIMFLMIILRGDLMGTFIGDNVIDPLFNKVASPFNSSLVPLVITGIVIAALALAIFLGRKSLMKNPLFARIAGFIKGIGEGLRSFYRMDNRLEFIFHTIFIWVNYILMSWVVVFMIPATSHLTFADATFILVIGSLGMSAPVQGGIGAFHWIVSRGLHLVYGISLEDGLAYATLAHESQFILIALLGAWSFYRLLRGRSTGPGKKEDAGSNTVNNINDGKK